MFLDVFGWFGGVGVDFFFLFLVCNVGFVFIFLNVFIENVVFFSFGFFLGLRVLFVCSWVRIVFSYLGIFFSYVIEENDNKLVLYGRDFLVFGFIYFVIGDSVFRELFL